MFSKAGITEPAKTVRILESFWPSHKDVDPISIETAGDWNLLQNLYSTLVEMSSSNTVNPALAEKWEQNAEGTRWIFYLKEHLQWSDGSDMTGSQIVQSLQRSLKKTAHTSLATFVSSITAQKTNQIVFEMKKTPLNFLTLLSFIDLGITHPKAYRYKKFSWDAPSSGAFQISTFNSNKIELKENTHHWEKNQKKISTATLYRASGSHEDIGSLLNDNFDASQLSPGVIENESDILALKNKYDIFVGNPDFLFCLNFSKKRTKQGKLPLILRQSLFYKIYNGFWNGNKSSIYKATGLRPKRSMGSLTEEEFETDFNALASNSNNKKVKKIDLLIREKFKNRGIVRKLIKSLGEFGIETNQIILSGKKYDKAEKLGEYDLVVNFLGASEADPDTVWRIYNDSEFAESVVSGEELNKAQSESNKKKREKLYKEFESKAIRKALFIPLRYETTYIVTSKQVQLDYSLAVDWGLQLYKLKFR